MRPHEWTASKLGHGETMCKNCFATNREAAAIGLVYCDAPPPKPANDVTAASASDDIESEFDMPFICPVTSAPCTTEQDEFCEDYGCARRAGIDVDRDVL